MVIENKNNLVIRSNRESNNKKYDSVNCRDVYMVVKNGLVLNSNKESEQKSEPESYVKNNKEHNNNNLNNNEEFNKYLNNNKEYNQRELVNKIYRGSVFSLMFLFFLCGVFIIMRKYSGAL